MNQVYAVLPAGVDDPREPSGGNTYDRAVCRGLASTGWQVSELPVLGAWPHPDDLARRELATLVVGLPDGAVVLVDAMIGSAAPEVLGAHSARLAMVLLVHLPLGLADPAAREAECVALACAAGVVVTSEFTRDWLLEHYRLDPDRVAVAVPGVDPGDLAGGTRSGGELLCVAAVVPGKGHDLLLHALARIRDLPWWLTCVGSLNRDPEFASHVRGLAGELGLSEQVHLHGPLVGRHLETAYLAADVVVLATRFECYGMVLAEALGHGLPVLASDVGGVPEVVQGPGSLPGILVPPEDLDALAEALRRWLGDPVLRHDLRAAARARRTTLPRWRETTSAVARTLARVAA